MKLWQKGWTTLAIGLCLSTSIHADSARPDLDTLFADMGIEVRHAARHYVVGDNVDGYFDGRTGGYRTGDGYRMGEQMVLHDYAAWVDEQLLDRRNPLAVEVVQPYGDELRLPTGQSTLMLHPGSRRLSLRVQSPQVHALALQPLWARGLHLSWREVGGVWVVSDAASGWFAAISADQSFEVMPQGSGLDASAPLLRARRAGRSFVVHIALARQEAQAVAQAQAMAGSDAVMAQTRLTWYERLTRSWLQTSDARYNQALVWAKASALSLVVDEYGKGQWAGLPWFRENWGRDTFIALPGTLLVSGQFDDARAVLENFARYQNLRTPVTGTVAGSDPVTGPRASDYGRIPNRVRGAEVIYNTVDGTPWMLREALEYVRYSGDRDYAARILRLAKPYIDGVLRYSLDADHLLVHDDADTWMDARIEGRQPWSARGSRAVEIQALWFTALSASAQLADLVGERQQAAVWRAHAQRNRESFMRHYWDGQTMADRLRADGSRDLKLRPNQLMLISIPVEPYVPDAAQARLLRHAVSGLMFPYGLASLSPRDAYFHPHHHVDANHHFDAAYHNGMVWVWNAGFAVTGLTKFGQQDLAYALSRNLADQILDLGTVGTLSELLEPVPDAKGHPVPSGTFSQAWSVSEFERNAYQDYLGFRPDLLHDTLHLVPALPNAWTQVQATLPYGQGEALLVSAQRPSANAWAWQLQTRSKAQPRQVVFDYLASDQARWRVTFVLQSGHSVRLLLRDRSAWLNGRRLAARQVQASQQTWLKGLNFAPIPGRGPYPTTQSPHYLQNIILRGEYK